MVNHIRTLLLNRRANAVTSTIFIPSSFRQIAIPNQFVQLDSILYPAGLTPTERVSTTDNYVTLLHMGELEQYTCRFDPRITYRDTSDGTLMTLCRTTVPDRVTVTAALARLDRLPLVMGTTLFTWPEYDQDMWDFASIWDRSTEGALRLGALLLSFAYQLERVRRGNT
jgi:hypothetical protein